MSFWKYNDELILSGLLYAVYETTWSKDAYAKRAYYVSVELGIDEPEKAYDSKWI